MRKLLLFLLLLPMAFAQLSVPAGENVTIYHVISEGVDLIPTTSAGVQIIYTPNNTVLLADPMISNGTGTFYYDYQTQYLGLHQVILEFVVDGTNYTRESYFEVTENQTMSIAIILGIIFIISALVYLAKDFFSKPMLTIPSLKKTYKWLDMRLYGVFLYLAAIWGLVILLYFLSHIAEGQPYADMLYTLYFVGILLVGALTILYTAFFFIFQQNEAIEKLNKVK